MIARGRPPSHLIQKTASAVTAAPKLQSSKAFVIGETVAASRWCPPRGFTVEIEGHGFLKVTTGKQTIPTEQPAVHAILKLKVKNFRGGPTDMAGLLAGRASDRIFLCIEGFAFLKQAGHYDSGPILISGAKLWAPTLGALWGRARWLLEVLLQKFESARRRLNSECPSVRPHHPVLSIASSLRPKRLRQPSVSESRPWRHSSPQLSPPQGPH